MSSKIKRREFIIIGAALIDSRVHHGLTMKRVS